MIKIFNKKTDHAILIDETLPQVNFNPKHYQEENPHVLIELRSINLSHHALTCSDCSALIDAFGTDTCDWHIEYSNTIRRLDLTTLSKNFNDNHLSFDGSEYFLGTRLKLNIDNDTIETLQSRLRNSEETEDYEGCSKIFDKINSIKG